MGYDRSADVAVLQLKAASNLRTITVGSRASIGEAVKAVGNAGGTGNLISARGTITGLDRSIVASDEQSAPEQLTGMIETNAGVQPGDSGGPLFDSAGRVLGMDTAASANSAYAANTSDAYAIPIGKALTVAKQIVSGNRRQPSTSAPPRSSASRCSRSATDPATAATVRRDVGSADRRRRPGRPGGVGRTRGR